MVATEQVLRDGACTLGVMLDDEQVIQLLRYQALVIKANQAMNLVSRKDIHRFTTRHLLDSLSIVPFLQPPMLVDIGSGAGLPGIPVAIARRALSTTLIDRSAKKVRFLQRAIVDLALPKVTAQCDDARRWRAPGVSTVVSRGMGATRQVIPWGLRLLEPGGCLLLQNRVLQTGSLDGQIPRSSCIDEIGEIADVADIRAHRVEIPGIAHPHEVLIVRKRG